MYQILFATANGWRSYEFRNLSDLMPTAVCARDWVLYVYKLNPDDPYTYSRRLIGRSARYFMESKKNG